MAETFATGILTEAERSFDCMGFEKATRGSSRSSRKGRTSRRFMDRHNSYEGKHDDKSDSDYHEEYDRKFDGESIYSDGDHIGAGTSSGKDGGRLHTRDNDSGKEDDEYDGSPVMTQNQKSNMDYIVGQIPEVKEKVAGVTPVCIAHFRTNSAGIFTLSDTMDPLAKLSVSEVRYFIRCLYTLYF